MTSPHIIRVVGMPRSGTAFASMLLNLHPDCIAYHELVAYDPNWKNTIENSDHEYVADCNTYGFLHDANIPCSVRIYLDRDAKSSHKASEKAFLKKIDYQKLENMRKMANKWAIDNRAYVVKQGGIFTLEGMHDVWRVAFGEFVPFPMDKCMELLKLNVQHHDSYVKFGEGVVFKL